MEDEELIEKRIFTLKPDDYYYKKIKDEKESLGNYIK